VSSAYCCAVTDEPTANRQSADPALGRRALGRRQGVSFGESLTAGGAEQDASRAGVRVESLVPGAAPWIQQRGSSAALIGFLAEKVLSRQPAQIRQVLARTAVLGRLCASLSAAISGSASWTAGWKAAISRHSSLPVPAAVAIPTWITPRSRLGFSGSAGRACWRRPSQPMISTLGWPLHRTGQCPEVQVPLLQSGAGGHW
jgi:hypothetical protein